MIKIRRISGDSMSPTLRNGSYIVISTKKKPIKDDIVLATLASRQVVKRIVDVPQKDLFFLKGDNYKQSVDSREYGPIKIAAVIGVIIWPKQ